MSKLETQFIHSIHKLLPRSLWAEKMNNPYRSGTADVWYSGKKDIWIEYKFLTALPVKHPFILPDCSALQLKWLRDRYTEGRTIYVVVGWKEGGVIFRNLSWEKELSVDKFRSRTFSRLELAQWIEGEIS